jgi:hypothetical protein
VGQEGEMSKNGCTFQLVRDAYKRTFKQKCGKRYCDVFNDEKFFDMLARLEVLRLYGYAFLLDTQSKEVIDD